MRTPLALLALLFAVLAGGCRDQEPAGGAAAPAPGNGPAAAALGGSGFKIAGIGMQEDQFFKVIEVGMKDAAKKDDVTLLTANSGGTLDKEATLIDNYLAQKVNAIVIAPVNSKSSAAALQRASDAGVKVVCYDSALDAEFPVAMIRSDQVNLGRQTGQVARKYIETKLGGKAKLAVISFLSLIPETASQRNQGFLDEMKKLRGVQIVAQQDAWMADKAVPVVDAILTAHPDVDVIWSANEGGTVGAVTAVKNAGKAGKVVVFGTDVSEQLADFLLADDNILQAVTGQKPFDIGSRALDTAVKALKGETVEKKVALPGVLFTREKPDAVRQYKEYLRGLGG